MSRNSEVQRGNVVNRTAQSGHKTQAELSGIKMEANPLKRDNLDEMEHHTGRKLCLSEVMNLFVRLNSWKEESQRLFSKFMHETYAEFSDIVNSQSNLIVMDINSLNEEFSDLKAQLSIMTQERNDLHETVKNLTCQNIDKSNNLKHNVTKNNTFGGSDTNTPNQSDNKLIVDQEVFRKESSLDAAEHPDIRPNNISHKLCTDGTSSVPTKRKMTGTHCSAVECHNFQSQGKERGIKFYRFPAEPQRRKLWELRVKRVDWRPTSSSRLSSEHFVSGAKSDDPYDVDYLPSVFANKMAEQKIEIPASNEKHLDIILSEGVPKSEKVNGGLPHQEDEKGDILVCEEFVQFEDKSGNLKTTLNRSGNKARRKYACGNCPYTSTSKSHLKEHIENIHEKMKRHFCKECDYASYHKGDLTHHIKKVHERSINVCEDCGYAVERKALLNSHRASVHGISF